MRRYELMLLFRPDLEDDKLQSAVEKVTRAIVNAGGALTKVSPWGKRRLAYEIKHFREASYFLLHFDIAPSQIREIERGMLISEEILRHLVTVLEDRGELSEDELPPAVPAARRDDADEDGGDMDDVEDGEVPDSDVASEETGTADDAQTPESDEADGADTTDDSRSAEPVEA